LSIGLLVRLIYLDKIPEGLSIKEAQLGWRVQNIHNSIFLLRLPSALFGLFSIALVYLVTIQLFPRQKRLALITSFLICFSPWNVYLSRELSEEIFAFVFLLAAAFFIFNKNPRPIVASLFFILSILFYAIGWDFNYLTDTSKLGEINLLRGESSQAGLSFAGRLFFNKFSFLVTGVLSHIFVNTSPSFIFTFPLLISFFPIFLFGLFYFVRQKNPKFNLLFYWLILGFVLSIFVKDTPDFKGIIFAYYPLTVICAYGLAKIRPKVVLLIISLVVVLNFFLELNHALVKGYWADTNLWHPETLEVAVYLVNSEKQVWLSDALDPNPGPAIAFLNKISFSLSNLASSKMYLDGWVSVLGNLKIGNYEELFHNKLLFEEYIVSKKDREKFEKDMACRKIESNLIKNYFIYNDCQWKEKNY